MDEGLLSLLLLRKRAKNSFDTVILGKADIIASNVVVIWVFNWISIIVYFYGRKELVLLSETARTVSASEYVLLLFVSCEVA